MEIILNNKAITIADVEALASAVVAVKVGETHTSFEGEAFAVVAAANAAQGH